MRPDVSTGLAVTIALPVCCLMWHSACQSHCLCTGSKPAVSSLGHSALHMVVACDVDLVPCLPKLPLHGCQDPHAYRILLTCLFVC